MQELALHLLDIAQNSIRAGATTVEIEVEELTKENLLVLRVKDNGKGMDEELRSSVVNPFVTTRTLRKVGLGLPLLHQLCEEANGQLTIESQKGIGTSIEATMAYNHIDRLPLGDVPKTIVTLIMGMPSIRYCYTYRYNHKEFVMDTEEISKILDGVPINQLDILAWIEGYIKDNISELKN